MKPITTILVAICLVGCFSKSYAKQAPSTPTKPTPAPKKMGFSSKATSVPAKASLTAAQRVAVNSALNTLRKLAAAAEIGVTASEYRNRLIDAKADVDNAIQSLPDGKVKSAIVASMQAYQDAQIFWGECDQLEGRDKIKHGESGPILIKYNLNLPDKGQDGLDALKRDQDENTRVEAEYQNDQAEHNKLRDTARESGITNDNLARRQELVLEMDKLTAREQELVLAQINDLATTLRINSIDEKKILSSIWAIATQRTKETVKLLN